MNHMLHDLFESIHSLWLFSTSASRFLSCYLLITYL